MKALELLINKKMAEGQRDQFKHACLLAQIRNLQRGERKPARPTAMTFTATTSPRKPLPIRPPPRRFQSHPPFPTTTHLLKQSKRSPFSNLYSHDSTPFPPTAITATRKPPRWLIAASLSAEGDVAVDRGVDSSSYLSLDAFLAAAEAMLVVPPAICSIVCLVESMLPGTARLLQLAVGKKLWVLQHCVLVGAVVVGCLVRRRLWRRLCAVDAKGGAIGLVGRVERVEQEIKESVTVVRMLSRQLEKLGVRFRVTKRAMRGPIAETAALAQKNSEATRALAMQQDNIEKELCEIQEVLLAMQEQQQKQLELTFAIGKAVSLLDSKHETEGEVSNIVTAKSTSSAAETSEEEDIEVQYERLAGGNNST